PSKALIRSAKFLSHVQRAQEFGMRSASADFDFGEVMERVQRVIKEIEPHDSVEPRRSPELTQACSPEADPASARPFVGEYSPAGSLR
ncbi:MAG: hypothetical protein Q8K93_18755, partial [Reyranella sp.]|nr:hypothetical protein [Reyranella sp.]